MEYLRTLVRKILKWNLKKFYTRVGTVFIWLSSKMPVASSNKTWGFKITRNFFISCKSVSFPSRIALSGVSDLL